MLKRFLSCIALLTFLLVGSVSSVFAASPSTSVPTHHAIAQPHASPVPRNPWGYNFVRGKLIKFPPQKFCNYFKCIKNFVKGRGYVVECKDATYSKSGGISGVCSGHRGYNRTL